MEIIVCFLNTVLYESTIHFNLGNIHCDDALHNFIEFYVQIKNEPRHVKTNILHMRKTKTQISFAVTAKLISAFGFAT